MWTEVIAFLGVRLIRLIHWSLTYRRIGPDITGPGVAAFWHGEQLSLLGCMPSDPKVAPVSLSKDGRLQARILKQLGVDTVDGSSSRAGARAAIGLIRGLRDNRVALVAVDGPRGPRHVVKPGALYVAQKAEACIWPVGIAVQRSFRIEGSWDQYLVPLPFSRVVMYVGEPWCPPPDLDRDSLCNELGQRIDGTMKAAWFALADWQR